MQQSMRMSDDLKADGNVHIPSKPTSEKLEVEIRLFKKAERQTFLVQLEMILISSTKLLNISNFAIDIYQL